MAPNLMKTIFEGFCSENNICLKQFFSQLVNVLGCWTEPGPGEGSLAQRDRHLQPGLHEGETAERE